MEPTPLFLLPKHWLLLPKCWVIWNLTMFRGGSVTPRLYWVALKHHCIKIKLYNNRCPSFSKWHFAFWKLHLGMTLRLSFRHLGTISFGTKVWQWCLGSLLVAWFGFFSYWSNYNSKTFQFVFFSHLIIKHKQKSQKDHIVIKKTNKTWLNWFKLA